MRAKVEGRLKWWCGLSEMVERASADAAAVNYAAQQDWIEVSPGHDPHSITLTEAGRSLAK